VGTPAHTKKNDLKGRRKLEKKGGGIGAEGQRHHGGGGS